MIISDSQLDLLAKAITVSESEGVSSYIVGGAVRDALLGVTSLDFDLVVEGDAISFAEKLQKMVGGTLKTFPNFLTAKILEPTADLMEFDVASAREEVYETSGALPKVKAATLDQDLYRRDFSINTLAVKLSDFVGWLRSSGLPSQLRGNIIDRFNGLSDLDQRTIKALHPNSFTDDPTRVFRACRYCARIQGELDNLTRRWIEEALTARALETISKFRILNELRWILLEERPYGAISLLFSLDVFSLLKVSENLESARLNCETVFNNGAIFGELKKEGSDFGLFVLLAILKGAIPTSAHAIEKDEELWRAWGVSKKGIKRARKFLLDVIPQGFNG